MAAAVEFDKIAVRTHARNFPASKHIDKDIAKITAEELLGEAKLTSGELVGLIGGPPCQGFSTMGRQAENDPRNSLFVKFFELTAAIKPSFFLAENVPGILADRNLSLRESAISLLPSNYVILPPFQIRANELGAPTIRNRVFFIGYDPERVSELKIEDFRALAGEHKVTVADALSGIPAIDDGTVEDGWAEVKIPKSNFFGKRLKGIIPPGVGDKNALKLYKERSLVSGFQSTVHTPETVERFTKLKPGQADQISKSVKLALDGYCPTLRAGTGPERGSYQAVRPVHPTVPRVICPREAARLQGFPDWFQFDNTKWHSFRQIGNSVSPIVAELILARIQKALIK